MHFYELARSYRYSDVEWEDDAIEVNTTYCTLDPGHQSWTGRLNELTIVLNTPKIGDFVWTAYSECLLSDKVVNLFTKAGFTGYELAPVTISHIRRGDKDVRKLPGLWELKLRGWGGLARPESGIRLLKSCPGCNYMKYSSYTDPRELIDVAQWDGSDIFMVWPLPRFVFITEKVYSLIKENKLTGSICRPVEKMPVSTLPEHLRTLSPGRLRMWFPEKRARELGEPLGIY
jgi:hypothetical protein